MARPLAGRYSPPEQGTDTTRLKELSCPSERIPEDNRPTAWGGPLVLRGHDHVGSGHPMTEPEPARADPEPTERAPLRPLRLVVCAGNAPMPGTAPLPTVHRGQPHTTPAAPAFRSMATRPLARTSTGVRGAYSTVHPRVPEMPTSGMQPRADNEAHESFQTRSGPGRRLGLHYDRRSRAGPWVSLATTSRPHRARLPDCPRLAVATDVPSGSLTAGSINTRRWLREPEPTSRSIQRKRPARVNTTPGAVQGGTGL